MNGGSEQLMPRGLRGIDQLVVGEGVPPGGGDGQFADLRCGNIHSDG